MKSSLSYIGNSLLHLFFPKLCPGCGSDLLDDGQRLCLTCLHQLPLTRFERYANNPVEKIFWGRIPVSSAAAFCYFSKGSVLQHLMHRFKYRGDQETGFFLGQLMGKAFRDSPRFSGIDALVPLPLHPKKERKRGYNQAMVLCQGMASAWPIPVWNQEIQRNSLSETQTHKTRTQRWENIAGKFERGLRTFTGDRYLLLVDDVVTTGATLEAAGQALLDIPGTRLSIATLAYTST